MLEETPGYIMRISNDDWVTQVFELKKYYSGIIRKWRIGTPILFAKKTGVGDSFLGYGITDRVEMLWEMTPEEEKYCEENGWKCSITFNPLRRFKKPLPVKETFLASDKRKGSFLHGALLSEDQIDLLLEQAEELQET
jgi:hypothetical protein